MRKTAFILPAAVVIVILGAMSVFIVDEREKALVLQFSKIVKVKEDPGLGFKIPFIQRVVRYDDRILSRDIDPLEVTPLNDRRLVVDAFARYRIVDVRRFRQAVGSGGVPFAESRLDSILRSQTREVLGSVSSNDILSTDRAALMLRIRNAAIEEAKELGLEVVDVRLQRTDLPTQNLEATFARMRAEREREAADEIARGNEAAQRVRAQADRTKVELVSDAKRKAEITRGEADAKSNAIFNEAFGADQEFFEFYRSLDAYRGSLKGENSSLVISPDSDFFKYFNDTGKAMSGAEELSEAQDSGSESGKGESTGAAVDAPADQGEGGNTAGSAPADIGSGDSAADTPANDGSDATSGDDAQADDAAATQ